MKTYGNRIKKHKREIETALPVHPTEKPVLSFSGINVEGRPDSLCFTEEVLDKNTLLIGPMGCGKTNTISAALLQMLSAVKDGPVVVADIKGDYSELLEKYHIPATYFGIHDHANAWNLFEDLLAWDETLRSAELRAEEFSRALFAKQKCEAAPYFADAAAILFSSKLKHMLREADETGDRSRLNNADLAYDLKDMDYYKWVNILDSYEDFRYALSILNGGDESSKDANAVLSDIAIVTNKIFTEAFAAEKGSFSPVKFIKSKKSSILVLRNDTSLEERTMPVMSVVLNSMFRALGSRNTSANGACFILDEFGRIPNLSALETALSLLRGKNVRLIAGMQISGQIERQKTTDILPRSLLDLFTNIVYMGGTGEALDYFQHRCGDRQQVKSLISPDGSIHSQFLFRPAVEAEDVMKMKKGDAYVTTSDSDKVFYFHFDKYLPQT